MYLFPSYVYKLIVKDTGQYYFGYRSLNKVSPEDDLLISYFSSSKIILDIIENKGINNLDRQIIYEDYDAEKAYWREQEEIMKHYGDPNLLNKHFIKPNSGSMAFMPTEESKKRMIETRRRRKELGLYPNWLKGQQDGHSKRYLVTPPGGESYEIFNLKEHCRKHNLNHPAMSQVGQGKKPHHKGWLCKRLTE